MKDYFKFKPLPKTAFELETQLKALTGSAADLNILSAEMGGVKLTLISAEGMLSSQMLSEMVTVPLMAYTSGRNLSPDGLLGFMLGGSLLAPTVQRVDYFGELFELIYSGFAVAVPEGAGAGAAFGIQGYEKRTVSPPESEQSLYAAADSFTEAVRTNISLIRRRLKTPLLRLEMHKAGELSRTDICIAYIKGRVSENMLSQLRSGISSIKLDTVLNTGYLQPFVDRTYPKSLFSPVMTSERPDLTAAFLNEGRAAIFVDGTPFCLILPAFFGDNFRTADDSCQKGYYVFFCKMLKYLAFGLAVLLPGLYAAIVMFHPEILSLKLLLNLAAAEEATPYPLTAEMLLVMLLFEIMREAGIRLPKAVGGAVSIVGGLIIGDAAVKSGLISQPLLIVVGITATASFVLPKLYAEISVLRVVFILAGGLGGLFGVAAVGTALLANALALKEYGLEYSAPLSPFFPSSLKDILARSSFYDYEKRRTTMGDFMA